MKQFFLFLLFGLSFILLPSSTTATHIYGGEIYWKCLSNGKFVFSLNIYIDCASVTGFPVSSTLTQNIDISGNNKPRNDSNQVLDSIIVKIDWNLYVNQNSGDITPQCDNMNGGSYLCSNSDPATIRKISFLSDPIILNGTPPSNGWTFSWGGFSRSNTQNIPFVSLGLRAKMYPIPNQNGTSPSFLSVNPCIDSSPFFSQEPETQMCRGLEYHYNNFVMDSDIDSLVTSWDNAVNDRFNIIPPINGFTFNNPLPDTVIDSSNIPVTLNPLTGDIHFKVNNGAGISKYTTVIRVDSYKAGSLVASIWRDIPFIFLDCPLIGSGLKNNIPQIQIESNIIEDTIIEVYAGDLVQIDFKSIDNDTSYANFSKQTNILQPNGYLFSKNFSSSSFCETIGIQPCATLNPPPVQIPGEPYKLKGIGGVSTQFRWQTACNHLNRNSITSNRSDYQFLMKTSDDYCPIPAKVYPIITIRIKERSLLKEPILKGASIGIDGNMKLNWIAPIDSTRSFEFYQIEGSTVNNGNTPLAYNLVQNNVNSYKSSNSFQFINFAPNLWSPFPPGKDYYFRMKTFSGCNTSTGSILSEPVKVIELNTSSIGPAANPNGKVKLDWNAPKEIGSSTKDYFIYESSTWYYVWQNDNANSDLSNSSNWYLRGSPSKSTSINLPANTCSPLVAFRVEARDTIITYKQGSGILDMFYDTLTFKTFGIIDVNPMQLNKPTVTDQAFEFIYCDIDSANSYQWINCNTNSIIPNATKSQYIPIDTGRFRVIVGTGNCIDTSACYFNSVLLDTAVTVVNNRTLRSNSGNQKFQWLDCRADTLIPGANGRSFSPSDTGYYAVEVSAYGYKDTSECIAMLAIGINETKKAEAFSIYPNPSSGKVFVQSTSMTIDRLRVFNQSGQVVLDLQEQGKAQFDFKIEDAKGIFIIEITDSKRAMSRHKMIFL